MTDSMAENLNKPPFGWITRFLVFCAGADKRLLRNCPSSDLVKIQGIGGVVAATGLLAFLSGSYAFYTVFSPRESLIGGEAVVSTSSGGSAAIGALVFGLIWALIIFNLDRFIVAASGPGDGKDTISASEFKTALPRLFMAILIGVVLAAPLEIRIMKTEIDAALSMEQLGTKSELDAVTDEALKGDRQRLDAELQRVRDERLAREAKITALQEQLKKFTEDLAREVQQGGNGRGRGDGPVAAALRQNMRDIEARLAAERDLLQPEIALLQREAEDIQARLEALTTKRDQQYAINAKNAQRDDGLMRRITLSHEIAPVASWLLTILLIVIEVAPIIFKMMLISGPYEYFVENEKRLAIAKRAISIRDNLTGSRGEMLQVKEAFYAEAEALADREVGKWRVESKLTETALEAHRQRLEADIRENPENYVDQPNLPKG